MIQAIVNALALLAVLMLGGGILLIGMAAMAAVYGCVFAKDEDEKFTIGVDFGRRHAEVEERAVDICEGMVNKYNRLMDALISQYTEEDEGSSSNFTLV